MAGIIEENKRNKDYLESVLYSIEITKDMEELKEIENEINLDENLLQQGEILKQVRNGKNNVTLKLIEKPDEVRIYIGKNNKQNDYIISKLASDEDLWFHTKDCPGSHILLKSQNVTDGLILECAKLAKENSKGKDSSKIGVIYTKCKYLRKPPKANLGYVTYKNEKEIIVN